MRKLTAQELIAWARMKFPEHNPPEEPQTTPPEDPPETVQGPPPIFPDEEPDATARRKTREQNAPGHTTPAQRTARWEYYAGRCWICGNPADCMDHVKPLYRGGSNWPANLRPACHLCNFKKNTQWPYPRDKNPTSHKRRLPPKKPLPAHEQP